MRAVIKYPCLKKFTTERVNRDLQDTSGENAPPCSAVAPWCAKFERDRTTTEDDPRSRRPTRVATEGRHFTRMFGDEKRSARRVPGTYDVRKRTGLNMSRTSLELLQEDLASFLARFTTVDEKWLHHAASVKRNHSL
ncbi:hypothetical protein EVAR_43878_1 [Eumeta japonica]|uniref:Mos1 transposase HTH domain-containing protein n=1 Tax=Eumeta variegata TaxID=151549 RepID=A0A4C1WRE0_EUMVA|nr:hypothetical protein EVAR_43878_1 [Eumeta japonica]